MADKQTDSAGQVTMCITNGIFIIGKLIGGNKLVDPRVFDIYMEQREDKDGRKLVLPNGDPDMEERIRMRPLPGAPAYCIIGPDAIRYPVVTKIQNVLTLYERVTNPKPEEERSRIILPNGDVPIPMGVTPSKAKLN